MKVAYAQKSECKLYVMRNNYIDLFTTCPLLNVNFKTTLDKMLKEFFKPLAYDSLLLSLEIAVRYNMCT
jgi:hypothetical protein